MAAVAATAVPELAGTWREVPPSTAVEPPTPSTSASESRPQHNPPIRTAIAQVAVMGLSHSLRVPEEISGQDASPAELVREHQLEVFAQSFPGWISAFVVLYCVCSPVAFGLFVWVIVSFASEHDCDCDRPLHMWTVVVLASSGYDLVHMLLLRYVCRYDPSAQQSVPCHVRVHLAAISLLDFSWLGVGIYFVYSAKTCALTAPQLYTSVYVYAIFSMVFDVIVAVNAVGLYAIMSWMLRNGLLSTRDAAPPGTLNKLQVTWLCQNLLSPEE